MYLLFSGEGPSDLGSCVNQQPFAEGADFSHGPLAQLCDQIFERILGYSTLEIDGSYGFLDERAVVASGNANRPQKGLKVRRRDDDAGDDEETGFFFSNARLLARFALKLAAEKQTDVVAILFRDDDATQSVGRATWDRKRRSMLDGFRREGFTAGVPMIPKPKSEAWFLCALRQQPYQHCEFLEDESGNDNSPRSLKALLEVILGCPATREELTERVRAGEVDSDRIDMPSFVVFRTRFRAALRSPTTPHWGQSHE